MIPPKSHRPMTLSHIVESARDAGSESMLLMGIMGLRGGRATDEEIDRDIEEWEKSYGLPTFRKVKKWAVNHPRAKEDLYSLSTKIDSQKWSPMSRTCRLTRRELAVKLAETAGIPLDECERALDALEELGRVSVSLTGGFNVNGEELVDATIDYSKVEQMVEDQQRIRGT